MSAEPLWAVRLSASAAHDIRNIHLWTDAAFGPVQAAIYSNSVVSAIESLQVGPKVRGATRRDDISPGLFALRVKMKRRAARHVVYFRVAALATEIVVVRVLHDAMEPARHVG